MGPLPVDDLTKLDPGTNVLTLRYITGEPGESR